jgi:hypothetical protein
VLSSGAADQARHQPAETVSAREAVDPTGVGAGDGRLVVSGVLAGGVGAGPVCLGGVGPLGLVLGAGTPSAENKRCACC